MTYVGGLRARLVRDSVWHAVDDALRALGWYEPAASHSQVQFLPEPVDDSAEIPLNSLALGDTVDQSSPAEMGSPLADFRWDMHVDVYAENDSMALHLVGDVQAILAGRLPSIGRSAPVIAVWDYTLATPVVAFAVEVESIQTGRATGFSQPWLRFWRTCSFVIVDAYGTEEDV